MATLKKKLSGGGWSTEALPSEFPVKVPFEVRDVPVQTYEGSFTTVDGLAIVNCGFVPDLVVVTTKSHIIDGEYIYSMNMSFPLFSIPDTENQLVTASLWQQNSIFVIFASAWPEQNGFGTYFQEYDYSFNLSPFSHTFDFVAYKWTA